MSDETPIAIPNRATRRSLGLYQRFYKSEAPPHVRSARRARAVLVAVQDTTSGYLNRRQRRARAVMLRAIAKRYIDSEVRGKA